MKYAQLLTIELILKEYKAKYKLSREEFIECFPITRQDTDNVFYFFLLT